MRWADPKDYDELGRIMFAAIHAEPSLYSESERLAWRAEPYRGAAWHKRLSEKRVLIAEEGGKPVGFLTIEPDGYIDLGYLLPEARGKGWFRRLYERIEKEARAMGEAELSTHASLSAEGPFKAMGFVVTERETVSLAGERLRRAAMVKVLVAD